MLDHGLGGPTRWGNQLNGNYDALNLNVLLLDCWPHSLGQSVEWKHATLEHTMHTSYIGPTRWGNQLNGNF